MYVTKEFFEIRDGVFWRKEGDSKDNSHQIHQFSYNREHSEIYFNRYLLNKQGTKISEGERVVRTVLAVNDNDTLTDTENDVVKVRLVKTKK